MNGRSEVVEVLQEALRALEAAQVETVRAERREDVTEVLGHVSNALSDLRDAEASTVAWLRGWGGTWQDVANVYGVSRQAASNRFGEGS